MMRGMTCIAQIATPVALDKTFDYLVPAHLEGKVGVGMCVRVPWGRTQTTGIVMALVGHSEFPSLKSILELTDPEPMIRPTLLELARWIADYYCTPLEQVLRSVLPAAVRRPDAGFKMRLTVAALRGADDAEAAALPEKQRAVMVRLWASGPQPMQGLQRDCGVTAGPVRTLERKGWLRVQDEQVARDPLSSRTLLPTTPLALSKQQAEALACIAVTMDALGAGSADGVAPHQSKLGAGHAAVPPSEAGAGLSGGAAAPRPATSAPSGVVLLYGVTGSGKTEVYLQAIAKAHAAGQGAIVLVPEIALTPQTIDRFVSRFGPTVAVLHSHLSEGERFDEWHRIRCGDARIVVGARSAVFAPVRALGIIVVDEEHEPSYKQEEAPRYHARDVAVMRGRLDGCTVVLGSATPALESWINARNGKYRLARMALRVDDRRMPAVRIVDMRVNAEITGHVSVFSQELLTAIQDRLARAEQTILFLNRRGFATSLLCPKCGFVAKCESCSISMTYHRDGERLRCHLCGASAPVPATCPACQDPAIRHAGFGTQRVEAIVRKCFPKARLARMDADTTTAKGSHDRILGDFRAGKLDILLGTQMIAKGLDFPRVTLVGVVNADLGLHLPDFRAGERTFQLLAQVSGRAGRGDIPGEVFVQTYTPHHPAMQAVRRADFDGFCDQEVEFRRELHYPPFARLVCLTLRGISESRVSFHTQALAERLTAAAGEAVRVSAAAPAPLARVKGVYRYQIMLQARTVKSMTKPIREVLRAERLPEDVKCTVDVDAVSLL